MMNLQSYSEMLISLPPIFKNNGTLYTLITDVSFKKYKKIVWQSWIITMLLMTHCSNDPFFDRNFNDSSLRIIVTTGVNISSNINSSSDSDNDNNITEDRIWLDEDQ